MATLVEVPKLGNTVEECIVARWCKRPGDKVSVGDIVAEIETDKATFEVAAPVTGTLIATYYDEGALAPVFTSLFVIGEPGESVEPSGAGLPACASPPSETTSKTVYIPQAEPRARESAAVNGNRAAPYSPRARKFARDHNFHPSAITGSGPHGRVLEQVLRRIYEPA